jgi:hypothetical protein
MMGVESMLWVRVMKLRRYAHTGGDTVSGSEAIAETWPDRQGAQLRKHPLLPGLSVSWFGSFCFSLALFLYVLYMHV